MAHLAARAVASPRPHRRPQPSPPQPPTRPRHSPTARRVAHTPKAELLAPPPPVAGDDDDDDADAPDALASARSVRRCVREQRHGEVDWLRRCDCWAAMHITVHVEMTEIRDAQAG